MTELATSTLQARPDRSATGSAIRAEKLGKCYLLYEKPIHRVWDLLLPRSRRRGREFWALRDVTLDIPKGSTVGIIGENGAGKSTLLKLLTGISRPTTGKVVVDGRMASLLELGAGFHPEFSGRENIRLNCSILGMSDEEIEDRYQTIIDFSELGQFIDRPVKTYSSGMYVRLGFAVAASVDPDILLIDEALSVGDEHFRGKCLNRLNEFKEQGRTIVFVSHEMGTVKAMCRSVILLDQGYVLEQGTAEAVADAYLRQAHLRGDERLSALNRERGEYPRWGSGEIEVHAIEMEGDGGRATHVFRCGEPFLVRLHYRVLRDCRQPVFGLGLFRSDGTYVNGSNHHWREHPIDLGQVRAGESGVVEMAFERMPLNPGEYYLTTYVYDHGKAAPTPIEHRVHALTFGVIDPHQRQHGLLFLPMRWSVRREIPDGTARSLESPS
jgi:ABC-type polysaccharide/polyol phosphate transport system ATPase subunit